jgi:hypothetical protein
LLAQRKPHEKPNKSKNHNGFDGMVHGTGGQGRVRPTGATNKDPGTLPKPHKTKILIKRKFIVNILPIYWQKEDKNSSSNSANVFVEKRKTAHSWCYSLPIQGHYIIVIECCELKDSSCSWRIPDCRCRLGTRQGCTTNVAIDPSNPGADLNLSKSQLLVRLAGRRACCKKRRILA